MTKQFKGYTFNGKAEFGGGEDILPILTIKKNKKDVDQSSSTLEKIKSKFRSGNMKNVTLKNTTEADYQLFTRLAANKDRATLTTNSVEELGLNKTSKKTKETLSFIVGKYKNKITDEYSHLRVFKDVYDRYDPMEVAQIITIQKGDHKIIEIRFITDQTIINGDWDDHFSLDSIPEIHQAPVKKPKWERMGISEEEFNRKKGMARLEDIQEQNPTQFQALLDLVESGNLDKLVKLADTL